jgi:hypothetical protein
MPVPTSNQGAESKRWLVPLLANSGAHLTPAWLRTGPENGVAGTDKPMILIAARSSSLS